MTVQLFVCAFALWAGLSGFTARAGQESTEQKKHDTFFAGEVTDWTVAKITVSRVVLGKTENRTFRITPDTKIEGRLHTKVRVTVRYVSDEKGDKATLIVVRTAQTKKK